ncbi:MAG TPA: uroporphyrinogen-III C-methyltransferase [Burkholderiaceae bacterium]|nr:uroporphyrinogen-III C-methyltransferase [Burkholderiaceae bacterium]
MSETLPQNATAPFEQPPVAPAAARPASSVWIWVLSIAALAAAGALIALRLAALQRDLRSVQQRNEQLSALHVNDRVERQTLQDRIEAAAQRTEQLEQQLTVLAGRDTTADAELRRLREEHVLAEVDELLTLAGSQLQVSHDPGAAISALASADARLARVPRPQFFPLREALARDIDRLRKAPTTDVAGVAIRLDRLVQGVDSWHMLADPTRHLGALPPRPHTDNATPNRLGWIGRELADTLRDLVRIRTVDAPDSLLLPPDQQPMVREHLRVRLLMARQAMMMRNQVLFRSDLTDSLVLINRYFDPTDPLVSAALAQIKALAAAAIDVAMPTLDDSLGALRAARPITP